MHRNLKPSEILLKIDLIGNMVAVISDFVLSKALKDGQGCSIVGHDSPTGWMSPEMSKLRTHVSISNLIDRVIHGPGLIFVSNLRGT